MAVIYFKSDVMSTVVKLGFHIRGQRKRLADAACGYGMQYANDLIPYTFTHAVALSFLV